MFRRLPLIALSLFAVAAVPKEDSSKTRSQISLDGTWRLCYIQDVRGDFFGVAASRGPDEIVICENRITKATGYNDQFQEVIFVAGVKFIANRSNPRNIEIRFPKRIRKGKMLPAIIQVTQGRTHDTLKICFSEFGRPKRFPFPGSGQPGVDLYVFTRWRH